MEEKRAITARRNLQNPGKYKEYYNSCHRNNNVQKEG